MKTRYSPTVRMNGFSTLAALILLGVSQSFPADFTITTLLPLEKGNKWTYTYNRFQTNKTSSTPRKTDTIFGMLSLRIDSLVKGTTINDTTLFRLAIVDSGRLADSASSVPFRHEYRVRFRVVDTTLSSLDTIPSPGFTPDLLLDRPVNDSSYQTLFGYHIYSSTRSKVTIGSEQLDLIARMHVGSEKDTRSVSPIYRDTSVAKQWIASIGAVAYTCAYNSWNIYFSDSIRCGYTLQSFNTTMMPLFEKPVLGVKHSMMARIRTAGAVPKQLYLNGSGNKRQLTTSAMYCNLSGRKIGTPGGSQLLIRYASRTGMSDRTRIGY
jgi:hypothetical protein